MISIEFTQSQCSDHKIHTIEEIECKLSVKFQNDYLDLIADEIFYEHHYSDIALMLINRLERVFDDFGITYSIHALDKIVERFMVNEHSFIQVDERFLSK